MNQPKPKIVDPTIDDMLTSIRDAIHEETAREAEEHARTFKTRAEPGSLKPQARHPAASAPELPAGNRGSSVSGSMRELRVSLQPAGQSHTRGTVTARSEDFLSLKNKLASLRQDPPAPAVGGNMESLLGGDARLDEAVERMNTAEQLQRQNTPVPPRAEVRSAPVADDAMAMRGAALDDLPGEPSDIAYSAQEAEAESYADNADEFAPQFSAAAGNLESVLPEFVEAAAPVAADVMPSQFVDHAAMHHEPIQPAAIAPAPIQPAPVQPAPVQPGQMQSAPIEPAVVLPRDNRQLPMHADPAEMMSGEAMRAAGNAFDRLSDELFSKTSGGAQVLEDSARDMIKPMLKSWLDDNLPRLVERLVREEIERVVRKGGR